MFFEPVEVLETSGAERRGAVGVAFRRLLGEDHVSCPPDQCIRDTIGEPRRKPRREEYTTRAHFFPAGITVIAYLTNLDRIDVARCRFEALPLASDGADGSPVRAIAIVE